MDFVLNDDVFSNPVTDKKRRIWLLFFLVMSFNGISSVSLATTKSLSTLTLIKINVRDVQEYIVHSPYLINVL